MSDLFSKVPRESLYEHVARQLQDLILDGQLRPGRKLPSEAELCRQFGVSRTVVREAIKSLMHRGLLQSKPGLGTYVTAMSFEDLSDSFGLFLVGSDVSAKNLIEVRELLEVRIAELAALRAKPEDVERMEGAVWDMAAQTGSVEGYIAADLAFHMAIAEATHNEVFLVLIGSLVDGLQEVRRLSADASAFATAQRQHETVLECVKQRDGKGAAKAMKEHVRDVARRYERAHLRRKAEAD